MEHKLPKAVKEQWLTALRSGQYIQGSQYLRFVEHEQPHFCCLGVLAETVDQGILEYPFDERPFADEDLTSNRQWCVDRGLYDALKQPPDGWDGCGWGVKGGNDCLLLKSVEGCLMRANDKGATFDQIAHMIERNL